MEVYCKCGCGLKLSGRKIKNGRIFYNKKHSAIYHGKLRKGTKLGPYKNIKADRDVDYSMGSMYCKKYNDDDINCVMCYEQYLDKECREK